jgi:hypothetical protein
MTRIFVMLSLPCVLLFHACTRSPTTAGNGGGIETVAVVITLPQSMRSGGSIAVSGKAYAIAPGVASFTLDIPKADTVSSIVWISGNDSIVLASGLSAGNGIVPKIILFVTGSLGPLTPADSLLRTHIIKENIIVLPVRDSQVRASDTAGTNGICLSATIDQASLDPGLMDATMPVIVCNYLLLDSLGLCGPVSGVDFGSRDSVDSVYVNGNRPGAAGLDGMQTFFDVPAALHWCRPPAGVVLTVVDPLDTTRAQSFCMETGTVLANGITAPGRRGAFLFRTADAAAMTSRGLQVFRAIVRWTFLRT